MCNVLRLTWCWNTVFEAGVVLQMPYLFLSVLVAYHYSSADHELTVVVRLNKSLRFVT